MQGLTRQVVLGLAVAVTLVMNTVAGTGLLFGRDPGSISDALPSAFTPAGFTFSIWSLIFLGLIAFAFWQARLDQRGARLDAISWPFLLSNVLNVTWLLAWHSLNYTLSVIVMLGLLASLVWLYVTLDRLRLQGAERYWLGVPTSLYLGWIAVATIANITAWLVSLGYRDGLWGLSAPTWSAVLIGVATLVGAFLLWRRRDVVFAAVLGWSFFGVYAARPDVGVIAGVILVGALVLLVALVGALRRQKYAY
jgi:hypothetical protein